MSTKVTLLFPGQGAQYVGMGKNLLGTEEEIYLKKADEILGYPLSQYMLEGPEDKLTLTENTQPAILTYSVALHARLMRKGIEVERVMGHSVGEYAALVAAGSLSFEDAVKLVHLRGKFMQEAVPAGKGKMVAVLKVPSDIVEKCCEESSTETEKVMPANFNEPGQIVISGEANACDRAVKWLEENYKEPYRAMELKVSAPFHSSLMEPAAKKLEAEFGNVTFNPNKVPYIANIDAHEYSAHTDAARISGNLVEQVAGSVRWSQSFSKLPGDTKCLEVGPGKVLFGLARKINRDIKVLPMDNEGAFDQIEEFIQ